MLIRGVTSDDARAFLTSTLQSERRMAWFRLIAFASGTLLFLLLDRDPSAGIPALLHPLLGCSWAYAIAVLVFEPHRRLSARLSTRLTTGIDLGLTLLWILATGGVASPWALAIYPVIVTASLRHPPSESMCIALFGLGGHLAVAATLDQLGSHGERLVVDALFIIITAVAGAAITHERLGRLKSRMRLLDLTQQVAQIGTWELLLPRHELSASDELYRLFGVDPANFVLTRESFLELLHPDDRAAADRAIDAALHEGKPFRHDHRIIRPDGTQRWLHCRGHIIKGRDGTVAEIVGFAQDVTEMRELHDQVLLSAKLASIGTLASGVAHEINNPLAYAANNLALLERELDAARSSLPADLLAKLKPALASARHGMARVTDIVVGLRTFARRDDRQSSNVDLARAVDLAIEIASHEITHRARLVREYRDRPPVIANESRLSQVLVNLLVNAAQSIHRGTVADNEIRVCIYRHQDRACVEVSDTGRGVPREHVERIFDPFFTTKRTGMGLGLSLADELLRDFGGRLELVRTGSEGTTFRLSLPAARSRSAPRLAAQAERLRKVGRSRLLIIDDEIRYAESMRLLLGADHEVTVATDAEQALQLLRDGEKFDLILCDLMMPGKTGMDLYEELGECMPELRERIVFLTGGATNERASELLERPDVRHLHKPVSLPALEALITEMALEGEDETPASGALRQSRPDARA